jgi:hypothetical protein
VSSRGGAGGGAGDARLFFNGILNQAAGSGYLHAPCTAEELLAEIRSAPIPPPEAMALRPGLDHNDLEQAGWGVIWAPGLDPRVREELAPLLELRRQQAGTSLFREVEAREGETYFQLLIRCGASVAPIDPRQLPYYLLLVGDPTDLSFELQYQLDVAHAVGRLSFATPEEYGRYAEGVVRAEAGANRPLPRRAAVFSVHNDDDPATGSCNEYLAHPLADRVAAVPGWTVDRSFDGSATRDNLLKILAGGSPPALLFTSGHGLMFYPDDPLHATDQGSLLCVDWPGPQRWKERIPPEYYLAARDVPDDADLGGLITFHFACFSAGTPELDNFSRDPGKELMRRAPRDMVAPLAQRLLGKPDSGALAVVGHVDQAFEASYLWPGPTPQLSTFDGCFQALMSGNRLGFALEPFGQRHATIAALITDQMEQWRKYPDTRPAGVSDALGEAFLWLAHNDARGYVLLGDPAVRVPVAPP